MHKYTIRLTKWYCISEIHTAHMSSFYDVFVHRILHSRIPTDKRMKNTYFRSYLMKQLLSRCDQVVQENTQDTQDAYEPYLKELANAMTPLIRKPQHLIESTTDYYVAWDMYTTTKYICYRSLACLDFDCNKNGFQTKDEILSHLATLAFLVDCPSVRIETTNGYHLFLLDRPREHTDTEWIRQMLMFGVDPYYVIYCYVRGYSIRLNPKKKDTMEMNMENEREDGSNSSSTIIQPIQPIWHSITWNNQEDADPHLLALVKKQFEHVDTTYTSMMT